MPPTGAYGLYNYQDSVYEVAMNKNEVRSIASITKMFTVYTVIKSGVDLNEKIRVDGKSRGHVPVGVYMSRMDLLRATVISSDNRAAETLAYHHPGGFEKFIRDVNNHINQMSLYNTRVVDSTGLLSGNVSTVFDLIEFLNYIKADPIIRSIANEKNAVLNVPKGKKTISINLHNTNPDLFVYDNILISKTGFTNAASRCVMMLVERGKELFAVIVLGQTTPKTRSAVVGELLKVETFKSPMLKVNGTLEYDKIGLQ
jgi:D-alanyl-D-alanine endopeptidase (penicillin-binding protein 7)